MVVGSNYLQFLCYIQLVFLTTSLYTNRVNIPLLFQTRHYVQVKSFVMNSGLDKIEMLLYRSEEWTEVSTLYSLVLET
jgi:hypothetical protein